MPDPPSSASASSSGLGYQIGVTVEGLANVSGLVLQDNGGDDLAISSSGKYAFTAPVANGSNYAVTVSNQPAIGTCFVANGTGTVNAANINVLVTCPWHMAYFAEPNGTFAATGEIVTAYIDQATGAVFGPSSSPVGPYPTAAPTIPVPNLVTVAVDPAAPLLFATTDDSSVTPAAGAVWVFRIDPGTGALTEVGTPYSLGSARVIAVDSTGKFLYVTNDVGIAGFTIDSASGVLTPVAGGPTPGLASGLFVHPSGKFLYSTFENYPGTSNITGYSIDSTSGALTLISSTSVGDVTDAAIDPIGKFLYMVGTYGGLDGFSIDGASGALTALPGNPFPTGTHPGSIGVDLTGQFLYVGNGWTYAYSISSTGALSPLPNSPYTSFGSGVSYAFDPVEDVLYAGGVGYPIDTTTGALGSGVNPLGLAPSVYNVMVIAALH